jgi:hypothetical protein
MPYLLQHKWLHNAQVVFEQEQCTNVGHLMLGGFVSQLIRVENEVLVRKCV